MVSRRVILRLLLGLLLGWSAVTPIAFGAAPPPLHPDRSFAPLAATGPTPATALPAPGTAVGDLRLTILFDNIAFDPRLRAGWGFAALVEYRGQALLFDTGADGAVLLENMRHLQVEPHTIEAVLLSHEHSDHTGGLPALWETGIRPPVYASAAFSNFFKERVRARTQLVEVTEALTLRPGIHLTRPTGAIVEQVLVVETRDGAVVITGFAHPGIATLVREAQAVVPGPVALLVGGFHLLDIADTNRLRSIIAELRQLGVAGVLPTHCTGTKAIELFRTEFGEAYRDGGVSRMVVVPAQ
jgi:7,8-dihydropterin-6-yl-methyl-4-(beta-D-ribofuranosyl)aminobenzene 5'-phosphate synthase